MDQGALRLIIRQRPHLLRQVLVLAHLPVRVDAQVRPLRAVTLPRLVRFRIIKSLLGRHRLECLPVGQDRALRGIKLTEQPWHQRVRLRIVRAVLHVGLDLFVRLLLPFPQGILQEILRPPLLGALLLQDVVEEIFVSLD